MNSGQANKATVRLLFLSVAVLLGSFVAAWLGFHLGGIVLKHPALLLAPWCLFVAAVLYLSRDPDPVEPADLNAIVSPAYGRVDVIEEASEIEFMQGVCKRVSIRMAFTDVQVQYAPLSGTVAQLSYQRPTTTGGQAAAESLFVGFDAVGRGGARAAVRLLGGSWGRRILPWIKSNDVVSRSVRIAMMRPGSRVDLYLPRQVKLHVNVGDEVSGGQSVVAKFE
jgi:phosphatidylserine decarboxylase